MLRHPHEDALPLPPTYTDPGGGREKEEEDHDGGIVGVSLNASLLLLLLPD